MAIRERRSSGLEALNLATELLQRSRRADPYVGIFEAADLQWAWRTPRRSDETEKTFWIDDSGPIAGILLTSFNDDRWQVDPLIVPGAAGINPLVVWTRAMEQIAAAPNLRFEIPISDVDATFTKLALDAGLTPGDQDSTGWLDADKAPALRELPSGFTLLDRTQRKPYDHPMSDRNGQHIGERLLQCSLYDPWLDLSIESADGQVAGYSLYWYDSVTNVGLVEPVRVHNDFQRQGLARVMLTHGIERLAAKGAERIKVSWETEAAGALYLGTGFEETSTTTWYSVPPR